MAQTPRDPRGEGAGTTTGLSWSPRGVTHPLWLASLALLIINDHVLKGAGVLPGWLTGKLSDFAGLIVAPVLLAVIMRARRAWARAAAFALVAGGFAAIKLWPAAARALEQVFSLAHVRARVWCDPTDLLALLVLPAAWWLTGSRARVARPAGVARRVFERASVIAGALACMATTPAVGGPSTISLLVVNRTLAVRDVAVYRIVNAPALDCAALAAGDLSSLATLTFERRDCFNLDPGEFAWFGSIGDASSGGTGGRCDVVVIRAVGLPDTVLSWPGVAPPTDDARANELWLEEVAGNLRLAGTDYVDAAPAAFTLPASGCPGIP